MKLYTKTGDAGQTALVGGTRVSKSHARVVAYGEVDELSSWLGMAQAHTRSGALDRLLQQLQRDLFALGAQLADPARKLAPRKAKAVLAESQVARLEREIDRRQAELPPLRSFILPGGSRLGALLHLARSACRRAERSIVLLAEREPLDPLLLVYVNRLSDLLFVLARHENRRAQRPELSW